MSHARSQNGMTLPEVLVALLVFSAIAATSVYALRLGVDSRDQLARVDDELKKFQIARTLIKTDFAQVTPRRVRNAFGDVEETVFRGNLESFGARREEDERLLAAFVRDGWVNPDAQSPRSALQYVEYVFRNGALLRRSRTYLDETDNADWNERVLFDDLVDARAGFLLGEQRGELEWTDIWPVGGTVAPPQAVSITIEQEGREPVEKYIWIGALGGGA